MIRFFEDGNVCVCGLRGRGKDMLMANVVVRRSLPYVSNIDYGCDHHEFNYSDFDCGRNTYVEFISGDVRQYEYPFDDGTDVYLSDAGIYFPSQFCSDLNRKFQYMPVFQAISRHVGNCNFHFNTQNLNRVWDKIREQSDIYILCRRCIVIGSVVLQLVTVYDKYQSAVDRQKPFRVPLPLLANKEMRLQHSIMKAQFEATHGSIKNMFLVYRNKSTYDTRRFKKMLEEGRKVEA